MFNLTKNTLVPSFVVAAAALAAPSVARSAQQTPPAPQTASCCFAPATRTATAPSPAAANGSQGRFVTRGKAIVWVQDSGKAATTSPAAANTGKAAACCATGAACCTPGATCCGGTATATASCCAK